MRQSLRSRRRVDDRRAVRQRRLEDNLNPVGRIFYSASTFICTPASRSQEVGRCLGAQAGEKRLHGVVAEGGFTRFRRATETPFNLIFEATALRAGRAGRLRILARGSTRRMDTDILVIGAGPAGLAVGGDAGSRAAGRW